MEAEGPAFLSRQGLNYVSILAGQFQYFFYPGWQIVDKGTARIAQFSWIFKADSICF